MLTRGFDHGFELLRVDTLHQVFESATACRQRLLGIVQASNGALSSSALCSASCGSTGARYTILPEQVQGDRAHVLQLAALSGCFLQLPGLLASTY